MPKVKELLSKWYPKKDKLNEFLQNLKINEKGRVEIEGLDLSSCGLSGHLYIPSLFEKIQRLDCFKNQLASLPRLPVALKVLSYLYNPLSQKTVQKIKSHPNYNSNWEIP